jgi:hypothetical protein
MANAKLNCLIGIVGYSPVLDAYPLGPQLMLGLERRFAGLEGIAIENMTWGPIHIVQHFQDDDGPRPARLILIGGSPNSASPGAVTAYKWGGGKLPAALLQERVYEAVTGIVDIDNTLAIGEHFGIWPAEVYVVEVDLPMNCFGDMVIADRDGRKADVALSALIGFSPAASIVRVVDMVAALAVGGREGEVLALKVATPLARGASFTRHRIARHEGPMS